MANKETLQTPVYDESQNWDVLSTSLKIYGSLGAALLFLFCIVRHHFPHFYNTRNHLPHLRSPLANDSYGRFQWIWKVLQVSQDDIITHCGMDAMCLLRVTRMGLRMNAVGIVCSFALFPIYKTADNPQADNGYVTLTATNVLNNNESHRYIGTVVAAYVIFLYTMYSIVVEFQWFTKTRAKVLSAREPQNYTVCVSGIPNEYRSDRALLAFFRLIFSHHAVLEASILLDIPILEMKVNERKQLEQNLERAIALRDMKHVEEPMLTLISTGDLLQRLPSIPYYTERLQRVNREIHELRAKIESQRKLADRQTMDQPQASHRSSVQSLSASPLRHPINPFDAEARISTIPEQKVRSEPNDKNSSDDESDDADKEQLGDLDASSRSDAPSSELRGLFDDIVAKGSKLLKLSSEHNEGRPLDAGFVTFSRLSTMTAAQQIIHAIQPSELQVSPAPIPDEILWKNVGMSYHSKFIGGVFSFLTTTMILLFWTVPMTFLVSSMEVDSLKEDLEFLQDWIEAAPWLEKLLNQIAPLIVTLLDSVVLPLVLREISKFQGLIGISHLEASEFEKLAAFKVFQTFIVASLAGGVSSALKEVTGFRDIVLFLGTTLPPQSVFFIQLLLIDAVVGLLFFELFRITALWQGWLRKCVGPRLTEEDKRSPWIMFRPYGNPRNFLHAIVWAKLCLHFLVFFVFSWLSPFVCYIGAFTLVVYDIGNRNQFLFIYGKKPDSGGRIWLKFVVVLLVCMCIAQLTLLGYCAIVGAFQALSLATPLFILTILFIVYLSRRHFRAAFHLSSEDCLHTLAETEHPEHFDFVIGKYRQPALSDECGHHQGVSLSK